MSDSSSRGAAVLRPSRVVQANEGLWAGLAVRSNSGRLLVGSLQDCPDVGVESSEGDHEPCHDEYGGHCPQTRWSISAELSESDLLGLRWPVGSVGPCGGLGRGLWPLTLPECVFPG